MKATIKRKFTFFSFKLELYFDVKKNILRVTQKLLYILSFVDFLVVEFFAQNFKFTGIKTKCFLRKTFFFKSESVIYIKNFLYSVLARMITGKTSFIEPK